MSDDENSSMPTPPLRRASDKEKVDTQTPPLRRASDKEKVASYESKPRMYISRALLFVDFLAFLLTASNVHGPVRILLGLTLGVVIPGWAVVGLLKLQNASLEIALAMAVSLSLLMITAEVLMSLHLWHLVALEEVTSFVCVPSLLWQSQLRRPTRKRAR